MINILKQFKFKPKSRQDSNSINPNDHWIILLRIFFILMIGLIIFDFYLLYQIKNDQIFQISSVSVKNTNSINENLLKKITDLFDQKEKKTIELQTTPVIYPDPSL